MNSSWIELDSHSFFKNILLCKHNIKTEIALVVKGNAYGHGLLEIAQLAQQSPDINLLCTGSTSEAIFLRQNNITKPILCLAVIDSDPADIINHNIAITISNTQQASLFSNITAHIKIDTGMSRLGFNYKQALPNFSNIRIEGIFTHLCDNTNPDPSFNYLQLEHFNNYVKNLNIKYKHAISSSGLYLDTNYPYNLTRLGAAAYGLFRSEFTKNRVLYKHPNLNLKSILTWKSKIIHILEISTGETIGYGRNYTANSKRKIAVIPVGYYDGYPRELSNKGHVLIHNKRTPIVGTISMNMLNVDITDIPNANINDVVTLLSPDLDYIKLAQEANMIPNDLFSGINPLIKRIVI